MTTPRPIALVLAVLTLAVVVSACGTDSPDPDTGQQVVAGETEGVYVDVEQVKYQVQISRQLNPLITDDQDYLEDIDPAEAELGPDEVWFAVFLRAQNETDEPLPAATEFEVHDTQENVYEPVEPGPANNFAWRPAVVAPKGLYPVPNSTPGERQPFGRVLLFKLERVALDNRPLELVIHGRETDQQATVSLDV